ncbi:hypothetical protein AcW1_001142 [Taiwanofungus camphoratus]|nr:hypothetical protein AcW1_001142 [Antrodia cinnamomea]
MHDTASQPSQGDWRGWGSHEDLDLCPSATTPSPRPPTAHAARLAPRVHASSCPWERVLERAFERWLRAREVELLERRPRPPLGLACKPSSARCRPGPDPTDSAPALRLCPTMPWIVALLISAASQSVPCRRIAYVPSPPARCLSVSHSLSSLHPHPHPRAYMLLLPFVSSGLVMVFGIIWLVLVTIRRSTVPV